MQSKTLKGCNYCQGKKSFGIFDIRKEDGIFKLYGYDWFADETFCEIYYCPMCGNPLIEAKGE